mmetsp:Transcript_5297/g.15659  ORF Transcript_5297/g.15659 Transcript_5297/m.15659 type:complete len:284 (-) Transcript_5297:44-895(-)
MSSLLQQLGLAGASNMIAAACTNPIDVIKTRMQIDGQGGAGERKFKSTLHCFRGVVTAEGFGALYRGVVASLLREGTYSGIRMGMYEPVKNALWSDSTPPPLYVKICAGAITGSIGSAIANPCDLLKVQAQSVTGSGAGEPSTLQRLRTILTRDGIAGGWRGCAPTVARATLLTASQIPSYDQAKHSLLDRGYSEGMALHFSCSMLAGVVAAAVTAPVDLAKTRIMNGSPHGIVGTIAGIARTEGPTSVYKGFTGQWLRIGPHTTISLLAFENLRHFCGLAYL